MHHRFAFPQSARTLCRSSALSTLAAALALTCTAAAQSSGFHEGDIYVYSQGFLAPGYNGPGIMRVDPSTGASSLAAQITSPLDEAGSMAFDPYRHGLVFTAAISPSTIRHLWLTDGAGGLQNLSVDTYPNGLQLNGLAPTKDGRIYGANGGGGASTPILWVDAANQFHVLYDSDGVTPMKIDGNANYSIAGMIHDAATNSLFVASPTPAPGFPQAAVNVRKLPLSADGSRVIGPVGNATFEASPNPPSQSSGEAPRGWSYGPNGQPVLCILSIDTNVMPRMLLVDPVTSAISVWGSNGSDQPPSWALTTGGAYSSTLNKVVVLDTSYGKLRAYAQGSTGGNGTLITTSPVALNPGFFYYVTIASVPDDECAGAGTEYGAGLAGTGGFVPRLASSGCPEVSSPFTLAIDKAIGGASGVLLIGTAPASLPLFGGSLLVNVNGISFAIHAGGTAGVAGAGTFALPLLLTDPTLPGASVYLQAGFFDPGAAQSVSLTNGLQVAIG
jgi:hypothetical protein